MRDEELRRALESVTPPDAAGARGRALAVVRAAYAEREPRPRRRPFVRPVLVLAAVGAVVAAAVSPPGRAVLSDVRDAIAPTRVERSAPALFALPSPGGLLVESTNGVWVVHADGSKRLLPGYREASWSPHGLFIVAARRNQLAALEANGDVRWTLARPDVSNPRWGGTFTDTRIAYVTHAPGQVPALRVVAGDGSGDHWVTKGLFPVAPAWKPGSIRVLAVAHNDGRVRLWNADTRALLAASPTKERPVALAWSHDGRRLYALGPRRLDVLDRRARRVRSVPVPDGWTATALAVPPRGRHVALVRTRAGRSAVTVVSPDGAERTVFSHPGRFGDLQWSPDGRWLLVGLSDADQWLFVPVARGLGRSRPVSNIMAQFDSEVSPRLSGWCCPP